MTDKKTFETLADAGAEWKRRRAQAAPTGETAEVPSDVESKETVDETPAGGLRNWLSENLKPELEKLNIKEVPPLHATFFLGRHGDEKDADDLQRYVKNTDMLLLEGLGSSGLVAHIRDIDTSPDALEHRREVARLRGNRFIEFGIRLFQNNAGSNLILTELDMPKNHPLYDEARKGLADVSRLRSDLRNARVSYDDAVTFSAQRLVKYFLTQKAREEYMIDSFGPTVLRVLKKHPELLRRPSLNITAQLGASHSRVGRQVPISSDVIFQDMPYVFDFDPEISRRISHQKKIPKELIEKSLIATIIFDLVHPDFTALSNHIDRVLYRRAVVNSLSEAERKDMYDFFTENTDAAFEEYVGSVLELKGIPWHNESEIRSYTEKIREQMGSSRSKIQRR